ncbi:MAG: chemotaxis protein CheW [Comamonas sp.]
MSASPEALLTTELPAFDACWQRIGVHGDRSCERLAQHVHCHNCERHAEAATLLLDRHELVLEAIDSSASTHAPSVEIPNSDTTLSALVFRIGQHWLALPSVLLLEVSVPVPVHGLPYPRNRTLRGLCNVRGTLVLCLALDLLLGLPSETSPQDRPRMLILDAPGGALVIQAHAVDGVAALPQTHLQKNGHTSGLAASQLAAGVLQWQKRSITLLDAERLTQAMLRSLA